MNSKILAIETSTDACSVALLSVDMVIDRFAVAPQQHTQLILPMIQEVLAKGKLTLNKLDALAFGCGPGSFTGVRLASSIVQGLAFSAGIPVVKVSTLRALAQEIFVELGNSKVIVAQDARMQEIYYGEYQVDVNGIMQPTVPDKLVAPQKIKINQSKDYVGVGNAWKIYRDILGDRYELLLVESKIYPQAKYVAQIAADEFIKGNVLTANEALPTYLREEIAWT